MIAINVQTSSITVYIGDGPLTEDNEKLKTNWRKSKYHKTTGCKTYAKLAELRGNLDQNGGINGAYS
jgi:hypothetical protein